MLPNSQIIFYSLNEIQVSIAALRQKNLWQQVYLDQPISSYPVPGPVNAKYKLRMAMAVATSAVVDICSDHERKKQHNALGHGEPKRAACCPQQQRMLLLPAACCISCVIARGSAISRHPLTARFGANAAIKTLATGSYFWRHCQCRGHFQVAWPSWCSELATNIPPFFALLSAWSQAALYLYHLNSATRYTYLVFG